VVAALGAGWAAGRARSPRAPARSPGQDRARAASARPGDRGDGARRRARGRARGRPRRPGPHLGLKARVALGVGALQRPRDGRRPAATRRLRRRRVGVRPEVRARARPEHAGGGQVRGRRVPLDEPGAREPQPEQLRPDVEARDGRRKIAVDVDAPRESLVGVTYTDPDGELAYCYNSEVASLRCLAYERDRSEPSGWRLAETLVAPGRAHFEYAQREPVPGLELHVR
jgi:hypothetical protein